MIQDQELLLLQEKQVMPVCRGCDKPEVYSDGFCYRCWCELKALGWLR